MARLSINGQNIFKAVMDGDTDRALDLFKGLPADDQAKLLNFVELLEELMLEEIYGDGTAYDAEDT